MVRVNEWSRLGVDISKLKSRLEKNIYGHFHVRVASEENSELAPGDF